MSEESISKRGGFAPLDLFFRQELSCNLCEGAKLNAKKHLLPHIAAYFPKASSKPWGGVEHEEAFAQVLMGYSQEGLFWHIAIDTPKIAVVYPEIEKGDAIQLFIDTRAVSGAKTTHRYCHQFFFLPEAFEGITKGEITRFRTEDSHPHCNPEDLGWNVQKTRTGYTGSIFIPASALLGYSPQEFSRLGFAYRITRSDGASQHFALTNGLAELHATPYLWSTLQLIT